MANIEGLRFRIEILDLAEYPDQIWELSPPRRRPDVQYSMLSDLAEMTRTHARGY